ncbi:MAG TPA: carbohydrate ABC transporter permease [Anaerolineae bacterium]|nr:carbohydrate ABC transporter permease [Anaerolineae bacterium]
MERNAVPFRRIPWTRARTGRLALELLVLLLCLAWLSPFYLLIVNTFKTMQQITSSPVSLPETPSFDAYVRVWQEANLGSYYKNSLLISAVSVVFSVSISSLAAYAFSRLRFPGKRPLFFFLLAGVMLPLQIALVPLYRLLNGMELLSTYQGMIALYVAFTIPFGIFILTGFFRSIPVEIEEAALIDGCGWFQSYWRIVMPLAAPGLVTMVILEFIWFWNEYLVALTMIQKEAVRTVMLGVMVMANTYQLDFSLLTAGIVISVVPPILVYVFFQKYLIRGLTAGAIK